MFGLQHFFDDEANLIRIGNTYAPYILSKNMYTRGIYIILSNFIFLLRKEVKSPKQFAYLKDKMPSNPNDTLHRFLSYNPKYYDGTEVIPNYYLRNDCGWYSVPAHSKYYTLQPLCKNPHNDELFVLLSNSQNFENLIDALVLLNNICTEQTMDDQKGSAEINSKTFIQSIGSDHYNSTEKLSNFVSIMVLDTKYEYY
jgi:hypothetical protein